jgi:hypothetical protein
MATGHANPQVPAAQSPSPMVDHTRPHPRIPQTIANGRRLALESLKGATLFIGPKVDPNRPVPLLIHFHGAPWLIEQHVALYLPHAALITVQLIKRRWRRRFSICHLPKDFKRFDSIATTIPRQEI